MPRSWSRPALLAAALTLAVFSPALLGGFLDWDDVSNLVANPYYRGFTPASLRWIFGFHFVHYYPLTWLSFAADHALWGLRPFGFHLTNVVLHAANAGLFCLILQGLLPGRSRAALFGALLFSLHPLRVESVAWATERSDLLGAFFYLLTVLLYLRNRSGAALASYGLSLAAKATGVMLPFTLLLLDLYRRRPAGTALREKAPFFGLAAAGAALTFYAQTKASAPWSLAAHGPLERLSVACYAYAFYLVKTLLPLGLSPLYPMPKPFWSLAPLVLASALAVAAVKAAVWLGRRRRPALWAAWSHYALTLLPVCGLIQTGPQLAADRYAYLSCLGWAAVAGAALDQGRRRLVAFALILVLAGLSWRQCSVWQDSRTFWSYQVALQPKNAIARGFLGDLEARSGRAERGEALLREALALDPGYGAAHNNLANLLANTGRAGEALEHYAYAIQAEPQHPVVRHNLALALLRLGRKDEAARMLEEELVLSPDAEPTKQLLAQLKR